MEKVIPYHIDEFKYVVEKCKCFPLHEVPLHSLTFATRFVAVFLFLRVQSAGPMTFQHLTVSVSENSKANNGFIDQKEFKTNLSYTFDSLVLDALPTRVIALYVEHVRPLLNPQHDYLLLTRNGTLYKKLRNAMCKLVYQANGKRTHPTRYRQIIETESAKKLSLEDKKNISLDQKYSSQVARIYYQKSKRVAADGQISMKRLLRGSRDTSDSLIRPMLFSEKSENDISKADLKKIKNTHRIDEEEGDAESFILCAQASPQKESKTVHEGTKASEPGDYKSSTTSDTVKEFKNSERVKRVPFTPEEDSFIRKGIKSTDLETGRQY